MKDLLQNPFHILGATTRSTKAAIADLAEHAELVHEHGLVTEARSDIVNTRTRMAVEVAWMPGASPSKAKQVISSLLEDPVEVYGDLGLPPLASANVMATALRCMLNGGEVDIQVACQELADHFEAINPEDVLRDVNEDRLISGYPQVSDVGPIEVEIGKRRRFYVQTMLEALDRLPSDTLVQVVTELVDASTSQGSELASSLISDLGDAYEKKVGAYLSSEAADISELISSTAESADAGADALVIEQLTARIIRRVSDWDKAAQPVQLLMQSRGLRHAQSSELAMDLRGLAVDLFNKHDYLTVAKLISDKLRELFAEVPDVVEKVDEDIQALDDIDVARREARANSLKEERDLAEAITYETTFGVVFKDRFRISPEGVEWKGVRRALDDITGLSWGGVRGQYGTTFDIFIGSRLGAQHVQFSDAEKFNAIVDRLWKAVGLRLLFQTMTALKQGKTLHFGDIQLSDQGVVLKIDRLFRATLDVFVPWKDVRKVSNNGQVQLTNKDGNAKGSFDLRLTHNAPVISTALDVLWKQGGDRLSSILD